MNIYVGNLSADVTDADLETLFSNYGKVSSVKIIRDLFTQESKGFGFIEMNNRNEAEKALEQLNAYEIKGKKIVVNAARPRRDRKSRGRR